MRLYNADAWQGASGRWYVNDLKSLKSKSCLWWFPIRLLDVTIDEFFEILKKYNAKVSYSVEKEFLLYSFSTRKDACGFRDLLNKTARKRGVKLWD